MMPVAWLTAAALFVTYWCVLRRWFVRWGTAPADRARVMAGDASVVNPIYLATLAITVNAPPDAIWPWLVQMGYRRGGLYSYDWLDRLFGYLDRPSATRILPEFQHLAVGDEIPIGRGGGFPVMALTRNHALVLGGTADGVSWVWQFGMYPIDPKTTRLVSRNSVRAPRTTGTWLFLRIIEPAAFLMTRRMLIGLKDRAEALEAERLRSATANRAVLDALARPVGDFQQGRYRPPVAGGSGDTEKLLDACGQL
jgi:hypothetical protein